MHLFSANQKRASFSCTLLVYLRHVHYYFSLRLKSLKSCVYQHVNFLEGFRGAFSLIENQTLLTRVRRSWWSCRYSRWGRGRCLRGWGWIWSSCVLSCSGKTDIHLKNRSASSGANERLSIQRQIR